MPFAFGAAFGAAAGSSSSGTDTKVVLDPAKSSVASSIDFGDSVGVALLGVAPPSGDMAPVILWGLP